MKKSILIVVNFFCFLIISSISFQPIIADDNNLVLQIKKSSLYDIKIDDLKELKHFIYDLKFDNNDCECEPNKLVRCRISCFVLFNLFAFLTTLWIILPGEGSFQFLSSALNIAEIALIFGCFWAGILLIIIG
jgi:hypothetical protein